jgi:hypothetical protein
VSMSSNLSMSVMGVVEFLLSASLGFLFWRRKLSVKFPAMGLYLLLRIVSTPVEILLFNGNSIVPSQVWLISYFYTFYAVYIVSAVILFFVCIEIFRSALAALPGLMKFGVVIFRWAALVSLIVTFSTVPFARRGFMVLPDIAHSLMRSVSILELCLLAFLCLCMNALRLSPRNVAFGLSFGFGLMAANDFIHVMLASRFTSLTEPLQFVYEGGVLFALGLWTAYCAAPEPATQPVVMQANSTIYRWNEIASALGHTGTQVAVQHSNSFFLTDVEKVVDKVLTRYLKSHESEV